MTIEKDTEMESERLRLAPPSMAYSAQLLEAVTESQAELSEFLPWVPYALTAAETDASMGQAISNFAAFREELRFMVVDKGSEQLLGAVGLIIRDKSVPYFEIGYWLRSTATGNGYITEAVQRLEQYALAELGARRLEIKMAETNVQSRAVAERCGYTQEGRLINERRLPSGKLDNTIIYAKTV